MEGNRRLSPRRFGLPLKPLDVNCGDGCRSSDWYGVVSQMSRRVRGPIMFPVSQQGKISRFNVCPVLEG